MLSRLLQHRFELTQLLLLDWTGSSSGTARSMTLGSRTSLSIVALLALLGGCMQYTLGNRSFRDKAEALSAQQQELAATLASVTPTETPVGGAVRIVIPTHERIAESGITKNGTPGPDVMDYVVTIQSRDLETMAAAVERRRIFRTVSVERSPTIGDPTPDNADFILWFHQPVPAAYQWYLVDTASRAKSEIPLDLSKSAGPERVNAWLAALERAARRLEARRPARPKLKEQP